MNSVYGTFRQKTFADVFPDYTSFYNEYNISGIPVVLDNTGALTLETLYYLLYGNYANSVIASSDINRFKYKVFSLIWQYAPQVKKDREIQEKLINLTDEQLVNGGISIYNNALNPGTEPSAGSDELLTYINSQNTSINRKGLLSAYGELELLLKKDVTQEFINRFKPLFLSVVYPENPLLYETEV